MSDHPIGRNAKCPCGSGRKFKQCCLKKNVAFDQDDEGTIRRAIPMTDEVSSALAERMEQMKVELGRELRPDDKLFPGQLEHAEHEMAQSMQAAGIDPAIIHAFVETGLLVSEEKQHLISDDDMARWLAAIEDFRSQEEPDDSPDLESLMSQIFESLDPESRRVLTEAAVGCESAEEFANQILIGPCPRCDGAQTEDCEHHQEIANACFGHCKDCNHLWCCFCEEEFSDVPAVLAHDCLDDDFDDDVNQEVPF